jgi:hypothetical protein
VVDAAQLAARFGPKHDRLLVDDEVQWKDLGCAVDDNADATYAGVRQELPAFVLRQVLNPGPRVNDSHVQPPLISTHPTVDDNAIRR